MSASASRAIDPERLRSTVERGEAIYAEHKDALEKERWGQLVAIEIETGKVYVVDEAYEELIRIAQDTDGDAFHLVRVGFDAAFDIGHIDGSDSHPQHAQPESIA